MAGVPSLVPAPWSVIRPPIIRFQLVLLTHQEAIARCRGVLRPRCGTTTAAAAQGATLR